VSFTEREPSAFVDCSMVAPVFATVVGAGADPMGVATAVGSRKGAEAVTKGGVNASGRLLKDRGGALGAGSPPPRTISGSRMVMMFCRLLRVRYATK